MNGNNGEVVIDLFDLFGLFIKKLWLFIILTVVGAGAAFAYTFFLVTPLYKSSALLYVNNSDLSIGGTSVSISSGDLTAAKSLVSTYSVILESRSVVNEVIEKSGVNYSYEKMVEMVEAKAVNNTEVFSITVTSPNPQEAEMLANLYAQVLPEKITEIVHGSDVHVVDYAVVANHRSSPSFTKNTVIGALVGFVIAAAIVVIAYISDDVIHTEDYLAGTYPTVPLLSVVPDFVKSKNSGSYTYYAAPVKKSENSRPGNAVKKKEESPFTIDIDIVPDGDVDE